MLRIQAVIITASTNHMTATHAEDTSSSRNSNITTASTNIMTATHGEDINLLTHGEQTQQTGDMTKHCTNKVLKQKIVTEFSNQSVKKITTMPMN